MGPWFRSEDFAERRVCAWLTNGRGNLVSVVVKFHLAWDIENDRFARLEWSAAWQRALTKLKDQAAKRGWSRQPLRDLAVLFKAAWLEQGSGSALVAFGKKD